MIDPYRAILFSEMIPVTGCTEPAVIALAAANAAALARGQTPEFSKERVIWKKNILENLPLPSGIKIVLDPNTFKNARAVPIPGGNGRSGIDLAAVIGTLTNPNRGIDIFCDLDSLNWAQMDSLCSIVSIRSAEEHYGSLFVSIAVTIGKTEGYAEIRKEHTNLVCLRVNDREIFSRNLSASSIDDADPAPFEAKNDNFNLSEIIKAVHGNLKKDEKSLLRKAFSINSEAAMIALRDGAGANVARGLRTKNDNDSESADAYAVRLASAACDARMGGLPVPIMTSCGSGNQGVLISVPLWALSQKNKIDSEKALEALAIAHWITYMMTKQVGRLSALCGVVIKAGFGLTAGAAYLLTNNIDTMENALQNFSGSIVGTICDGAKPGCAMKVLSSVTLALQAIRLAQNGCVLPAGNGILEKTAVKTMTRVGSLATAAQNIDTAILKGFQKSSL